MSALPTATGPKRRRPPLVAWVVLLVVLVGVAAALLAAPGRSSGAGPPALGPLPLVDSELVIGVAVFALLATVIGLSVRRGGVGGGGLPQRFVAIVLVVVLLGALFVALAGLVAPTSPPTGPGSTGSNATSPATPAIPIGNGTSSGGFSLGAVVPAWLPYVGVVALAVILVLVIAPFAIARWETRRPDRAPPPAAATREAVVAALAGLREGPGADARGTILVLYGRLLAATERRSVTTDPLTPREVQAHVVRRLGVRPAVVAELTALFEEARYSAHPMTPAMVDRAERTLTDVLADLDAAPAR